MLHKPITCTTLQIEYKILLTLKLDVSKIGTCYTLAVSLYMVDHKYK